MKVKTMLKAGASVNVAHLPQEEEPSEETGGTDYGAYGL